MWPSTMATTVGAWDRIRETALAAKAKDLPLASRKSLSSCASRWSSKVREG